MLDKRLIREEPDKIRRAVEARCIELDIDKIAAVSRSLEAFFAKQFSGKMHRVLARDDIKIVR